MKISVLFRIMLGAVTIAILVISLAPAPPPEATLGWDKANHATAMAVVTAIAVFSLRPAQRAVLAGCLYALMFGVLIELLQFFFTTTRTAEWGDIVADSIGIAAAAVLLLLAKRTGIVSL